MTVTLAQVAAGLKARLDTINGLYAYDYPDGDPNLPAGVVITPEIDYRQAMRVGVIRLDFEIHLLVGSSSGHQQQKHLWGYLDWVGTQSVLAAVDANRSLGIASASGEPLVDAHVSVARPLGLEELPASAAFGAALTVPVVVTNKE